MEYLRVLIAYVLNSHRTKYKRYRERLLKHYIIKQLKLLLLLAFLNVCNLFLYRYFNLPRSYTGQKSTRNNVSIKIIIG